MRELAKSLTRFSWAMSLFGARELLHLVRRPIRGDGHPASADLASVARAGERQLDGIFERTYAAGDRVQKSVVDLVFGMVSLEALDPSRMAVLSANVLRESTSAVRSLLPGGAAAAAGSCGEPCGWGPMPPAR